MDNGITDIKSRNMTQSLVDRYTADVYKKSRCSLPSVRRIKSRINYVDILSGDLILQILSYIDDISDLRKIQVCKLINKLTKIYPFLRDITITQNNCPTRDILHHHRLTLERVHIMIPFSWDLTDTFPMLRELVLKRAPFTTGFLNCPNLQRIILTTYHRAKIGSDVFPKSLETLLTNYTLNKSNRDQLNKLCKRTIFLFSFHQNQGTFFETNISDSSTDKQTDIFLKIFVEVEDELGLFLENMGGGEMSDEESQYSEDLGDYDLGQYNEDWYET